MKIGGNHPEDFTASLNHRIAEAEMRSTAAAGALADLIRTDGDIGGAEGRLNEELDRLLVLRRRLAEVLLPMDA